MYNATVQYETKKGNLKTANIDGIIANDIDQARRKASKQVRSNKLRQCKRVLDVSVGMRPTETSPQPHRGFFARLFRS